MLPMPNSHSIFHKYLLTEFRVVQAQVIADHRAWYSGTHCEMYLMFGDGEELLGRTFGTKLIDFLHFETQNGPNGQKKTATGSAIKQNHEVDTQQA
jgi:hypothetical protein